MKSSSVGLSFRVKLGLQFFALTLLTIGGLTSFFLSVYSRDKLSSAYERELSDSIQAAQYLENSLLFAKQASAEQIVSSPSIIFAVDNPCAGSPVEIVSKQYQATLERLQLLPGKWLASAQLKKICPELKPESDIVIVPALSAEMRFPAAVITALLDNGKGGTRLALISMEGIAAERPDGLLGLVSRSGSAIWSSDQHIIPMAPAGQKVRDSFDDKLGEVGSNRTEMEARAGQIMKQGLPSVAPIGKGGIAASAPVLSRWVLVALAAESSVLSPVRFFVTQALWLTGGFLFLCLLAGKLIADNISKPLIGLSGAAREFGKGNLNARVEVTQADEFGVLQGTFNSMASKIEKLLDETRTRALLEADVQVAHKVQEMLFPEEVVRLKDHEITSTVKMASKCGGDWWGYIDLPEGQSPLLLVLIGDVTGHGISAALITAAAQGGASVLASWVRSQPELAKDPRFLLRMFNRAVYESARGAVQMSFFSAVIDVQGEMLYASNAAHNWPYIIAPGEGRQVSVKAIGNSSPPLGQQQDVEFTEIVTEAWKPGYQLFMYTDGLIDAYEGNENKFDRRALLKILRQSGGLQGASLLKKVILGRSLAVGTIPQQDDITAVVCVRKGRA